MDNHSYKILDTKITLIDGVVTEEGELVYETLLIEMVIMPSMPTKHITISNFKLEDE